MNFKTEDQRLKTKDSIPAGNIYDKYHTKNHLYKFAINRFLKRLENLVTSLGNVQTVLEVGCADGYLLNRISRLKKFSSIEGIDISKEAVVKARESHPSLKFYSGSVYSLNYKNDEFDLVLACEVLEHLEDPNLAMAEVKRVTKKFAIVSVPLEPLWRIANLARGAYIFSLGNTPGHIQHWNRRGFLELMKQYFIVKKISYPLPWQMALCRK